MDLVIFRNKVFKLTGCEYYKHIRDNSGFLKKVPSIQNEPNSFCVSVIVPISLKNYKPRKRKTKLEKRINERYIVPIDDEIEFLKKEIERIQEKIELLNFYKNESSK